MSVAVDIPERLRALAGPDAVVDGDAAAAFTVDGLRPRCVVSPATIDELSRCVAAIDQAGLAMIPAGNGAQLGVGRAPRRYDVAVSTRRLRRIVAHAAADMTVVVEAGLTLGELNAALAQAGQRLPVDPPYPERMTVGALIATDASGPWRLSQGKVRDLLIGIKAVLADGTVIKGGGRVVKNVAGYDVMKLFTGSFGTLGIIVEAAFKVRPLPECEAVFIVLATSIGDAVAVALEILSAPLAPLYVETLNQAAAACVGLAQPAVVIGCGGSPEEIEAQRARLEAGAGNRAPRMCAPAEGARLYAALRDFPALLPRPLGEGRGEGICGCKVSVLPSKLGDVLARIDDQAAVLAHVGSGVAYIRVSANPPFAERLCATARAAGGWVVFDALLTALKDRIDPWGPEPPGLALMRGIKQTLDPHGRLSPGRFVGGI